ncbi:MAG: hypothetical protein WDA15_07665 [Trueperaceae bacterium]
MISQGRDAAFLAFAHGSVAAGATGLVDRLGVYYNLVGRFLALSESEQEGHNSQKYEDVTN